MSPDTVAPVFRTPDERFAGLEGYPFVPKYLMIDALRLHYLDEGSGTPCLLLHGEPTWSYLYRKIIPVLTAAGLRAVAPDYFGFGRSDKPTDLVSYTFERHVESMRALVRALDLREIVLVMHDWGGPIGMRLASLEPDRIARLVILNTGLFTPGAQTTPALRKWREFVASQPDLDIARIVSGGCATQLTPEVAAGYGAPFPTQASKAGARAFPLMIPTSIADPGAAAMVESVQLVGRRRRPTLVLWGDQDPIFPPHTGTYLSGLFAGADSNPIQGAAHFLQEDKGPEIGARIVEFTRTNW